MKVFDHNNVGNTCEIIVFFSGLFKLQNFTLILRFLFGRCQSFVCQSFDHFYVFFFVCFVFLNEGI